MMWLRITIFLKYFEILVQTALVVEGTMACQILAMLCCVFGVGSNWYLYNFGTITGRCLFSSSLAKLAIAEKPKAAPFFDVQIALWFAR